MAGYKLKPQAEKDLEAIWLYTAQEWGIEQAIQYIGGLNDTFQALASTPLICRERSEFSPPVRIHHHIRHLVVYLIEDAHITIVRVLHDSMELQERLVEDHSNSM